eukprot:Gb_21203 [translate_table: standard]
MYLSTIVSMFALKDYRALMGANAWELISKPMSCGENAFSSVMHYMYIVESKNTPEGIAYEFEIIEEEIMSLNGISNALMVLERQVLDVSLTGFMVKFVIEENGHFRFEIMDSVDGPRVTPRALMVDKANQSTYSRVGNGVMIGSIGPHPCKGWGLDIPPRGKISRAFSLGGGGTSPFPFHLEFDSEGPVMALCGAIVGIEPLNDICIVVGRALTLTRGKALRSFHVVGSKGPAPRPRGPTMMPCGIITGAELLEAFLHPLAEALTSCEEQGLEMLPYCRISRTQSSWGFGASPFHLDFVMARGGRAPSGLF